MNDSESQPHVVLNDGQKIEEGINKKKKRWHTEKIIGKETTIGFTKLMDILTAHKILHKSLGRL